MKVNPKLCSSCVFDTYTWIILDQYLITLMGILDWHIKRGRPINDDGLPLKMDPRYAASFSSALQSDQRL